MTDLGPLSTKKQYLSVPFELVVESRRREHGWVRHAEYPELGLQAEDGNVLAAIDDLERARHRLISERFDTGQHIPVPRPPLHSDDDAGFLPVAGSARQPTGEGPTS